MDFIYYIQKIYVYYYLLLNSFNQKKSTNIFNIDIYKKYKYINISKHILYIFSVEILRIQNTNPWKYMLFRILFVRTVATFNWFVDSVRNLSLLSIVLFKHHKHTIESNDRTSQVIVRCNNHFQYFRSHIEFLEKVQSCNFLIFIKY